MFRLLIWNIQFFTQSRINDDSGATVQERSNNSTRTLANLLYILSTVEQADPDVFVVLEVRSGQGNIAELASGEGPAGLIFLLGQLREWQSASWCLVPPLRVNPREQLATSTYTEAVGVFWRNDRVNFTGPYVWPAARVNTGPPIAVGAGAAAAAYPAPWSAGVPGGLNAAPRVRFYSYFGDEIVLANPQGGNYARRPLLTTFTETGGMGRTIKLFSVHTKPSQASQALVELTKIQGADWTPGNNEVTVFAGDFNINLLGNLNTATVTYLNTFKGNGLRRASPPYLPNGNLPQSIYHSNRRVEVNAYLKDKLYDYGFVTYGAGAQPNPLPPTRSVIVDRVAGVTPGGVLPAFDSDMSFKLPNVGNIPATNIVNILAAPNGAVRVNEVTTITTAAQHDLIPGDRVLVAGVGVGSFNGDFRVVSVPGPTSFTYNQTDYLDNQSGGGTADTRPQLNAFRSRWNYGHIAPPISDGTSDHLPLFMLI